eukprot:gb/GFBE01066481.1/.p1 GENE.gb/GFBE01066481.1/~~gb/GFBE01066481.1/.p1  ORF type:complete len:236 (+),score=39.37 gb/GFBE01066481.1/:1-708(+)
MRQSRLYEVRQLSPVSERLPQRLVGAPVQRQGRFRQASFDGSSSSSSRGRAASGSLLQAAATARPPSSPPWLLEGEPWDGCEDLAREDLAEWMASFPYSVEESEELLPLDPREGSCAQRNSENPGAALKDRLSALTMLTTASTISEGARSIASSRVSTSSFYSASSSPEKGLCFSSAASSPAKGSRSTVDSVSRSTDDASCSGTVQADDWELLFTLRGRAEELERERQRARQSWR